MKIFHGMALLILYTLPVAQAQDAVEQAVEIEKPYEIVIRPTMTRLNLRELIVEVEDDFFNRYNELNTDNDYDVICYKYVPTMSHISKRVCEPVFLILARSENAAETATALARQARHPISGTVGTVLLSPKAMRKEVKPDLGILQEKLEALNATDDQLHSIGSVLANLRSRLANFGKE